MASPRDVRPITIVGAVAYVPLSQGRTALIDASDIGLVEGRNWFARSSCRGVFYAGANRPRADRHSGILHLHRVVLGAPDGMEVDHINGDGLDNRRSNLRLATSSQQKMNRGVQSNNRSGLKGAYYHACRKGKKWRSQIKVGPDLIFLGYFATAEEAHRSYRVAAEKYHLEFARVSA